ncbi:MAG: hypothetical protein R3D58_17545 [Saprospiraceae bacterium]
MAARNSSSPLFYSFQIFFAYRLKLVHHLNALFYLTGKTANKSFAHASYADDQ